MSQLIVVGFKKDMFRAPVMLNELQELNDDWVVDLHDAVAAYRDYSGNVAQRIGIDEVRCAFRNQP